MLQGEHSAIFSTFIKLPLVIKTFVLCIFEWPLKTAFNVFCCESVKHSITDSLNYPTPATELPSPCDIRKSQKKDNIIFYLLICCKSVKHSITESLNSPIPATELPSPCDIRKSLKKDKIIFFLLPL